MDATKHERVQRPWKPDCASAVNARLKRRTAAVMRNAYTSSPLNLAATIVELLISIAVLAVLIGLTAPAINAARIAAEQSKSLSNLHMLSITLAQYASVHKGKAPFAKPAEDFIVWGFEDGPRERFAFAPVWALVVYWPAIVRDVAPWREHFETWRSPGRTQRVGYRNTTLLTGLYAYSNSFLARPRLWSGASASEKDIGPVLVDMVASPSAKVVFFDAARAYLRRATPNTPRPLLFVDGAAALKLDKDAATPVQNPLRRVRPQRYHDTPLGVRGRDF